VRVRVCACAVGPTSCIILSARASLCRKWKTTAPLFTSPTPRGGTRESRRAHRGLVHGLVFRLARHTYSSSASATRTSKTTPPTARIVAQMTTTVSPVAGAASWQFVAHGVPACPLSGPSESSQASGPQLKDLVATQVTHGAAMALAGPSSRRGRCHRLCPRRCNSHRAHTAGQCYPSHCNSISSCHRRLRAQAG
jgi:hypothetical protein